MHILLVEDDQLMRKALANRLQSEGHLVHEAKNGKEALDIVLDNPIDLIICDLMMPIISGVTFLNMRNKFMSPDVPVIVTSSLQEAASILTNLGIEYNSFLHKPFSDEQLLGAIEEAMRHRENRFKKSTLTH